MSIAHTGSSTGIMLTRLLTMFREHGVILLPDRLVHGTAARSCCCKAGRELSVGYEPQSATAPEIVYVNLTDIPGRKLSAPLPQGLYLTWAPAPNVWDLFVTHPVRDEHIDTAATTMCRSLDIFARVWPEPSAITTGRSGLTLTELEAVAVVRNIATIFQNIGKAYH